MADVEPQLVRFAGTHHRHESRVAEGLAPFLIISNLIARPATGFPARLFVASVLATNLLEGVPTYPQEG